MRELAALAVGAIVLATSRAAAALVCTVPGTTIGWATDQCLLETAETDPRVEAVLICLSKISTIRQPCEWNESYKQRYCETLVAKGEHQGSVSQCISDPTKVGPTVRQLLDVPPGGA